MDWFLDDRLAIGNAYEVRDQTLLHQNSIEAICDLASDESPANVPRSIIYMRIPIQDNAGNPEATIRLAIRSVVYLLQSNIRTLVGCSAGLSRSPCIASGALANILSISPDTALSIIQAKRSTDISPALWGEVKQFCANAS